MAGKVPIHLYLGCLCHSDLGLRVSLDTLMYIEQYISPHGCKSLAVVVYLWFLMSKR